VRGVRAAYGIWVSPLKTLLPDIAVKHFLHIMRVVFSTATSSAFFLYCLIRVYYMRFYGLLFSTVPTYMRYIWGWTFRSLPYAYHFLRLWRRVLCLLPTVGHSAVALYSSVHRRPLHARLVYRCANGLPLPFRMRTVTRAARCTATASGCCIPPLLTSSVLCSVALTRWCVGFLKRFGCRRDGLLVCLLICALYILFTFLSRVLVCDSCYFTLTFINVVSIW